MKRILMVALSLLLVCSAVSAQCLLTFQTESLPGFFVGQPINFQIEAVSGTEPYKFEIVGGALPEGVQLTPSGRIVGVTQEPGEVGQTVFIRVTDAEGCSVTQAFDVQTFE